MYCSFNIISLFFCRRQIDIIVATHFYFSEDHPIFLFQPETEIPLKTVFNNTVSFRFGTTHRKKFPLFWVR